MSIARLGLVVAAAIGTAVIASARQPPAPTTAPARTCAPQPKTNIIPNSRRSLNARKREKGKGWK